MKMRSLNVRDYGAVGDGSSIDTDAFQRAIDEAADIKGRVTAGPGRYLIGSIFLKSNMELHLEKGAILLGVKDIEQYPVIESRIAGIEMAWPAAMINIINQQHVKISGKGIIDGQGECWWELYWGKDGKGGQRKSYDANRLRWIADYEIRRPRLCLVYNSENIELEGFTARRSGFWTIQVTYCHAVHADNIKICDNAGPSTDGIDIDSSSDVLVENCQISCNDDNIAVKSGRDADGMRVGRVCKNVEIRNCEILSGAGITIGSEVSGGIYDIYIHDNTFKNTDCGFRIKSSRMRGGTIENIMVEKLKMQNVQFPFSWLLDWYPAYNKFAVLKENVPEYWNRIAADVPPEKQYTQVRKIEVKDIETEYAADYEKSSRAFDLQGTLTKPIEDVMFKNIHLLTVEFGNIVAVKNIHMDNVAFSVRQKNTAANDIYDQR